MSTNQTNFKFAPYSHSKMASWQMCPRKFKYQYIDKIPVERVPQFHFDKGSFVHLLFEHDGNLKEILESKDWKEIKSHNLISKSDVLSFIEIYKKFKEAKPALFKRKTLWKELPIGITADFQKTQYSANDALFRGFVDAVYLDEATNTLIIVDWKTGKSKTKDQQSWQQLLFYAVALFGLIPYDTIILMYAYVEHQKTNTLTLHRKNLDKYKKALSDTIDKIEKDTVFHKNETPLCDYCDYQEHCRDDSTITEAEEIAF